MTTPILGMDELTASQSQPHLTVNAALRTLEAVVQITALAIQNAPPVGPLEGDVYILGPAPTWDGGVANDVAVLIGGGWTYLTPGLGWLAFIPATVTGQVGVYRSFTENGWVDLPGTVQPGVGLDIVTDSSGNTLNFSFDELPTDTTPDDADYAVAQDVSTSAGAKLVPVGAFRKVGIPQNLQSVDYTLTEDDNGRHILHATSGGSGDTYTIPANATDPLKIGHATTIINLDTYDINVAINSDTLTWLPSGATGTRILAQYACMTILKVSATQWIGFGVNIT